MDRFARAFAEPDELFELQKARSAIITKGGITVSYDVAEPGWRWSTHIRPVVKTEWCEVHHIGVLVRGRLHGVLQDGTEFQIGPMSLMDIPAGHDAWVAGDEPAEMIEWSGVREWLKPLDTLSERVLATLVFTDLVGSTATAIRMGRQRWGELRATHEQRARDIVRRFRGRNVQPTGDGILADFDGAARAVRCAIALRDAAIEQGLEMRTGVHTGEVDLIDDEISGIAIHEASRIMALAGAGQILVSETTTALIRDAGIPLEDLGEHELRGVDKPLKLFAIS